jgi:hypothetical protein
MRDSGLPPEIVLFNRLPSAGAAEEKKDLQFLGERVRDELKYAHVGKKHYLYEILQ